MSTDVKKRLKPLTEKSCHILKARAVKTDPWPDLPLPRLQFYYDDLSGGRWDHFVVTYALITQHFQGHVVVRPMGRTIIGPFTPATGIDRPVGPFEGGGIVPAYLYRPFREGVHIRHDAKHLNLPAFAAWDSKDKQYREKY